MSDCASRAASRISPRWAACCGAFERVRVLRGDDLGGAAPLGRTERLAQPFDGLRVAGGGGEAAQDIVLIGHFTIPFQS